MRLKMMLLIVGVVAIVIGGCGGGDSTSGGTTAAKDETGSESKPMTKAQFKSRISEICIQVPPTYEEELQKLEKELGKKPSKAETNLKAAIPPLESAIEQMEATTPPPGKEEQHLEEVITALEAAIKGLEAKPTSELSGGRSPFLEFQQLTTKYGFETCSGL